MLILLENRKGFTLVELILAVAISGIVGLAAYTTFVTSSHTSRSQEEISEMQQNVRVAMNRMAQDIRMAGFGLPQPPYILDFDTGTAGDEYSAPITVNNQTGAPDSITILGIGHAAGTLNNSGGADCNGSNDNTICVDNPAWGKFFPDGSTFKPERRYISIDGVTFFELDTTGHDATNNKLALTGGNLARAYPDGTPVYILQAVTYNIETDDTPAGCTNANPCLATADVTGLRLNGTQMLAENIEDIQFAYGVDVSPRDGAVDYSGTSYNSAAFRDDPADETAIVAVRANVVGRSRHPDNRKEGNFQRPALEDRAAGAPDGYRRRTLTQIIQVRNSQSGGS